MKVKASAVLILVGLAAAFLYGRPRLSPAPISNEVQKHIQANIDYTEHTVSNLNFGNYKITPLKSTPIAGITSHHLPTAEKFIDEFYFQLKSARPDISSFIIIGPDHFERCKPLASTTDKNFLTPFGVLENDEAATKKLMAFGVGQDSECFLKEHAIGVQATFIKKYFPKSKAAVLIFSSAVKFDLAQNLAKEIEKSAPESFVIISADFSHYESLQTANQIDSKTEAAILKLQGQDISLVQVDTPAGFMLVMELMKLKKGRVEILNHANSYDFTGKPTNTTSYFNVIFTKE